MDRADCVRSTTSIKIAHIVAPDCPIQVELLRSSVENLIMVGAFECFGHSRRDLLRQLRDLRNQPAGGLRRPYPDEYITVNTILRPHVFQRYKPLAVCSWLLLMQGRVVHDSGAVNVPVDRISYWEETVGEASSHDSH